MIPDNKTRDDAFPSKPTDIRGITGTTLGRSEPRAEADDYPFICGFSLWTGDDNDDTRY